MVVLQQSTRVIAIIKVRAATIIVIIVIIVIVVSL